jgi:hypothetical protein
MSIFSFEPKGEKASRQNTKPSKTKQEEKEVDKLEKAVKHKKRKWLKAINLLWSYIPFLWNSGAELILVKFTQSVYLRQ